MTVEGYTGDSPPEPASLSAAQRQQVDAIFSLLITPDRGSVLQGIELAAALDDQAVFDALLDGVRQVGPPRKGQAEKSKVRPRSKWRRYYSIEGGSRFADVTDRNAWIAVALTYLIAASEHPLRTSMTSLALGEPKRKASGPIPPLWLSGLERLTSLTHLDLFLGPDDKDIDLGPLQALTNLTHLRIRGAVQPPPIPSLNRLEVLDAMTVRLPTTSSFPELMSLSGQIGVDGALTPALAPKLSKLSARSTLRVEGFTSFERLWCNGGPIEVLGCEQVGNLRLTSPSFHAPDLRRVGTCERIGTPFDVSQLERCDELRMNQVSKLTKAVFPPGTTLSHPEVRLWGPGLTDLGNIGELSGMEVLSIRRATNPLSLESLRHATNLRVLDIALSTGITDLTPIVDLPNLETIVVLGSGVEAVPESLEPLVRTEWRKARRLAVQGTPAAADDD